MNNIVWTQSLHSVNTIPIRLFKRRLFVFTILSLAKYLEVWQCWGDVILNDDCFSMFHKWILFIIRFSFIHSKLHSADIPSQGSNQRNHGQKAISLVPSKRLGQSLSARSSFYWPCKMARPRYSTPAKRTSCWHRTVNVHLCCASGCQNDVVMLSSACVAWQDLCYESC